jgi:hypothetical protein
MIEDTTLMGVKAIITIVGRPEIQVGQYVVKHGKTSLKITNVRCPYCRAPLFIASPNRRGRIVRVLTEPANGQQEAIYEPVPAGVVVLSCCGTCRIEFAMTAKHLSQHRNQKWRSNGDVNVAERSQC